MNLNHVRRAMAFVCLTYGCTDDRGWNDPQGAPETAPKAARDSNRAERVLRKVGTAASVLDQVLGARAGRDAAFAFLSDHGERIAIQTRDFFFVNGVLSMTGSALGSKGSTFILKGTSSELRGWVVLNDRDVAYRYFTNQAGEVMTEQVLVTDIYPICDDPSHSHAGPESSPQAAPNGRHQAGNPPHVGAYDGSDVTKLQSLPGAEKVLFMEMDVLPLDDEEIWIAWQTVAASYSAFDVNVTTDAEVYDAAGVSNSGKACYNAETGRSSCAVDAFGTTACCNIYNKESGYYEGTTSAHELGHLMGLYHDGDASEDYFMGLEEFKWCPIMGANPPKLDWGSAALFQWSKGEYDSANNEEDDLAIIENNLEYRADDIPDSKPLVITGTEVAADVNFGQIASNTDTDTFTFTMAAPGRATLTVDRIEFVGGGYLDVAAQIQDASGALVVVSNEDAARFAVFDLELPAGDYKLIIEGGAEGTPSDGFSKYSSLGFYGISGTITVGGTGGMGGNGGAGGVAGIGGSSGLGGAGGVAGTAGIAGTGGLGGAGGAAGTGDVAGAGGVAGMAGFGGGLAGMSGGGGAAGIAGSGGVGVGGMGAAGTTGVVPSPLPVEGCACRVGGTPRAGHRALLLLGFLGLLRGRRQRRAVGDAVHPSTRSVNRARLS